MRRPLLFLPFLLLCSALCGAADLPSAAIPGELTVRGRELFAGTQTYPSYPAYADAVHVSTSLPRIERYDMKGELWDPARYDNDSYGPEVKGIREIRFCDGYETRKSVFMKKTLRHIPVMGEEEERNSHPEEAYEVANWYYDSITVYSRTGGRPMIFDSEGNGTPFPKDYDSTEYALFFALLSATTILSASTTSERTIIRLRERSSSITRPE